MRKKYAIVVAAGKGLRMKMPVPKQFLSVAGRPVLYHSIAAFLAAYADLEVILVLPPDGTEAPAGLWEPADAGRIHLTTGGNTRFDSVKNGLALVEEPAVVMVHDGVRPLVPVALIHACYAQALAKGSAIPVVPIKDSLRRITGARHEPVDRSHYVAIQTPQTFLSEILLPAFAQPYRAAFTDEATVVEASGHPVHLIAGSEGNIKITRPVDLHIAAQLFTHNKA